MLLEALVACAGVTVSAVATAMGVKLRSGRVIAEGHWDARGTLGVDRDVPVGGVDVLMNNAGTSPGGTTMSAGARARGQPLGRH
ncbi:MAG TPA: hypothetical protein VHT21_15285 [Stellaceae bacterium]|jgi:uncharacterized OsmC-like protein|nr:hypothetical protein [Stellaceae bacterium]